jgi:transmembrane sensor
MNEERDLLAALKAADQELSRATLSAEAKARIGDKLASAIERGRHRRSTFLPVMAVALAGAAALLWIMSSPVPTAPPAKAPAVARAAGFAWQGTGCSTADGALHLDGSCRARVEEMQLSISSGRQAELIRLDDGVRLRRGSAEFEVVPRDKRRPLRVWVSRGAIEVTGTRFTVEQRQGGGHVDLLEGSIRFRAADGTVTLIHPGTRFEWLDRPPAPKTADRAVSGQPPAPPSRVETGRPAGRATGKPRSPSVSSEAADDLIEAVHALRAERRYREAADLLEKTRTMDWDRRTAEVLSVEEGDLLEHLGDKRTACAHWRAHVARFPGGRHGDAIRKARARLSCR